MERLVTVSVIEDFAWILKGITPDELPKNFIPILTFTNEEFHEFRKELYKLGGMTVCLFDINELNKYQTKAGVTFKLIIE